MYDFVGSRSTKIVEDLILVMDLMSKVRDMIPRAEQ